MEDPFSKCAVTDYRCRPGEACPLDPHLVCEPDCPDYIKLDEDSSLEER